MSAPAAVGRLGSPGESARRAGVLDVFLLALSVPGVSDVAAAGAGREPAPLPQSGLFLPASTGDPASTALPARLAAIRELVDFTGDELELGRDSAAIHVGRPANRLSLWIVPGHGAVLACEAWHPAPTEGLVDWHAGRIGATVDSVLAPFGLTVDARLHEVFPDLDAALPDLPLSGLVAGTGHERASAALAIEVSADDGRRVRQRVDGGGTDPAGWSWDGIALVDRPVRDGAAIAVREDSGAILFDLDAAAADHDHDVFGVGEMIHALVPWVAVRAGHARDYRLVLDHLRAHETLADERLQAALDDVAAVQARRMERMLLATEARHDGVELARMSPAQLRTLLVRRLSAEMTTLDGELGEGTRAIERALLRSAERRGDRQSRLAHAWSVAAGAIAVVAVFAALAAVPAVDEPTLFGHWFEALVATLAITAGVVLIAVFWRRPGAAAPSGPLREQPAGWQDRGHGTHAEPRR